MSWQLVYTEEWDEPTAEFSLQYTEEWDEPTASFSQQYSEEWEEPKAEFGSLQVVTEINTYNAARRISRTGIIFGKIKTTKPVFEEEWEG